MVVLINFPIYFTNKRLSGIQFGVFINEPKELQSVGALSIVTDLQYGNREGKIMHIFLCQTLPNFTYDTGELKKKVSACFFFIYSQKPCYFIGHERLILVSIRREW